jgi:hypothetical protein
LQRLKTPQSFNQKHRHAGISLTVTHTHPSIEDLCIQE